VGRIGRKGGAICKSREILDYHRIIFPKNGIQERVRKGKLLSGVAGDQATSELQLQATMA
jgi:hypothetical protein